MKQILFAVFFIFGISKINAQFAENNAIYQSIGITVGNYVGLNLHANYVLKESYSFKLGYSGAIREPESKPEYYSSGLVGALSFGLAMPFDQLHNFQIMAGKVYRLNKKGTIRANLSLGLAFTSVKEPTNWEFRSNNFIVENYTFDYHSYNTFSLIINPKIEFPFTWIYGLELSPMVQLNKDRTYYGIGIGHMIGLLRKKPGEGLEEEKR